MGDLSRDEWLAQLDAYQAAHNRRELALWGRNVALALQAVAWAELRFQAGYAAAQADCGAYVASFSTRLADKIHGGEAEGAYAALQEELARKSHGESPSGTMLYLNGSPTSFRCEECGANVFTEVCENKYRCNGCGERYTGK